MEEVVPGFRKVRWHRRQPNLALSEDSGRNVDGAEENLIRGEQWIMLAVRVLVWERRSYLGLS